MRPVLCTITIDDNRVSQFNVATLKAPASNRARRTRFTTPSRDVPILVLHIDVEVGVRIRPFNLCKSTSYAERLAGVKLRGERMMRKKRHCQSNGYQARYEQAFHEIPLMTEM